MYNQVEIFGYSCLCGVMLGILYDIFRLIRLMSSKSKWNIFVGDIIYFALSGFCTFLFILAVNYGEIRFYIFAGEVIGWSLYHITFGELVYKFSSIIIEFLSKIYLKFTKFFYSPIINTSKKIKVKLFKEKKQKQKNVKESNKI